MRQLFLSLLMVAVAQAEDPESRPTGRVALGSFSDRFSDATGTWSGWSLSGQWFRDERGPWSFGVVENRHPEGKGHLASVSKEYGFGETSSLWVGLSAGWGADVLPRFRAEVDLDLELSGPWGIGLQGAQSRFRDGGAITQLQLGPRWLGERWSASARFQSLQYSGGGGADASFLLDLRRGPNNLEAWQSLRVGLGRGLIDALQPGGSAYSTTTTIGGGAGRGRGPGSGAGTGGSAVTVTGVTYPQLQEQLIGLVLHQPLWPSFALRTDLAWAKRETQFVMWSLSLQALVTF